LGQLQSYVWLNQQAFSKIMKKYDKHMKYRGTDQAKSVSFDARLEQEPFKNKQLDSLLEMYRAVRSKFGGRTKAGSSMEMRLISGS
jgi:SPX domain protein involved in polyphosphate accumulation